MKMFALLLAGFLSFQVASPVICMTNCDMMAIKQMCATEENECSGNTSSCCSSEATTCEMTLTACEDEEQTHNQCGDESKDCCTPCCAGPLCCFFEESTEIVLTPQPVIIAGKLPSSNDSPLAGYIADCWQPPELNS